MKQTIKKLVLVVMCFTLICCEEKESNDNSFNFQQKTKTENPFNYLGERHNHILDDFAESLGNSVHFSTKDVYNFSVNEGHLSSNNISYLDYKRSLDSIDDITFDYFFGSFCASLVIGIYVGKLTFVSNGEHQEVEDLANIELVDCR